MLQLSPGEYTAIARQLADPNDSATYYVRAVVRNARTNTTIETVDLTDRGGQLFSKEWQVPSTSSDAVYVIITTRVYTDSAYTVLSTDYGQELEMYLIENRIKHAGGGGDPLGGTKWRIDYEKFREIIQEENKEIIAGILSSIPADKMMSAKDLKQLIENKYHDVEVCIGETEKSITSKIGMVNVKPQVMIDQFLDKVREAAKVDASEIINVAHELLKNADDFKDALEKAGKNHVMISEFLPELKNNLEVLSTTGKDVYAMKEIAERKLIEAIKALAEMYKLDVFGSIPDKKKEESEKEESEWEKLPATEIIKQLRAGHIKK